MPNELTQPCPACTVGVDLGRRITLCVDCWVRLAFHHSDLARRVIYAWQDRNTKRQAYMRTIDDAVTALRRDALPVVDLDVLDVGVA